MKILRSVSPFLRFAWNEDQPRDEDGKFGDGGGGSSDGGTPQASKDAVQESISSMTPDKAAAIYSQTLVGGATVAKASEHYIANGEKGLTQYVESKGGPDTGNEPSIKSGDADKIQDYAAAAKVLVDKVREQDPVERTLFRGVAEGSQSLPGNLTVGSEFSAERLTSFSSDDTQAAFYATGKDTVLVELRGRSQALSTDEMTGMGHKEFLTFGKFRVVEVRAGRSVKQPAAYKGSTKFSKVIVIEQVSLKTASHRSLHLHIAAGAQIRTASFRGKDHVVVPVVALKQGVIQASNATTPELVLAAEFSKNVELWNSRPVMFDHPTRDGAAISANAPDVLEGKQIGVVFGARVDEAGLKMEAWLDPEMIEAASAGELVDRLRAGDTVDVSVGVVCSTEAAHGTYKGASYVGVWRDVRPDHLAMLPAGVEGACSIEMGCGAPRAAGYNPDQPRDDDGKFGDGGGSGSNTVVDAFSSAPGSKGKEATAWIKANQKNYENDPEFRSVADAIALHTQGDYATTYAATSGDYSRFGGRITPDSPMSGSPATEYKSFFKGQDVQKGGDVSWKEAGVNLGKAIDKSSISDSEIHRGLMGRDAFESFKDLKVGDSLEIPGATSFTSSKDIAEKFASGRGPGQYKDLNSPRTIITIEKGAPGIRSGALSPYKQDEVISRGKFEVVFNQEGLSEDRMAETRYIRLRRKS